MVYPHTNDLGKNPPPAPNSTKGYWADMFNEEMNAIKHQVLGNMSISKQSGKTTTIAMLDELIKDTYLKPQPFPEPIKKVQPDFPAYSQQAHALRLELKVSGFGIGEQRIGAQWMVSNEHTHNHGGLPIDQAEHLIDTMLADIKKNLMNQIKEKAK